MALVTRGTLQHSIDRHTASVVNVSGADAGADLEAVLRANTCFYEAFERRDLDAMSDLWVHGDRPSCTHPGWPTLTGWSSVASAWATLLANTQHLQFILTNVRGAVNGDTGWVTCDENILDGPGGSTVAACNVFVRDASHECGWKLVLHHGSVVHASLG